PAPRHPRAPRVALGRRAPVGRAQAGAHGVVATLRVRGGRLWIDGRAHGVRFREAIHLDDTPDNRAKARSMVRQIDGELAAGAFDYAKWFPHGRRAHLFRAPGDAAPPRYATYARGWFEDASARWAAG